MIISLDKIREWIGLTETQERILGNAVFNA